MDKQLAGRRILIVEDEMVLLMTIEDMMADLGCKSVTSASTVDKAASLADGQVFDAAILDMNLNGNTSRRVADTLVARGEPFIVCTGNSGNVWDDLPAAAILQKPHAYEPHTRIDR